MPYYKQPHHVYHSQNVHCILINWVANGISRFIPYRETVQCINELTDLLDSGLCFVKWLLIWALRTGAMRATSQAEFR
ncbi:unnamed protein product [Fusarium graminearum]|uniref:Chromosome 4, complete genome n=2 Tax=Gibberella zeae TaxID=5518 RepID=A0A098DMF7_GIBZE|nr:unnamed protein product [Fusarium graminearum]CAF3473461.1 unnamed protein product [Fusarium graminearum]CAF3508651.1 unnamed protein product [Fusarium graminearum]CAG1979219.1 unnamed protein product [Fusarium graminearum]CAG1988582.1 unnamed protein product [Fusarium graminearum]